MSDFKEFTGKNVDEAIELACKHFETPRNKLEIEILAGGSTGIFGLVGVKKASVRARLRQAEGGSALESDKPGKQDNKPEKKPGEKPEKKGAPKEKAESGPKDASQQEQEDKPAPKGRSRSRGRRKPKQAKDQPAEQAANGNPAGQQAQPDEDKDQPQKNGKPSGRRKPSRRKPRKPQESGEQRSNDNRKQNSGNNRQAPAERPADTPMDPVEAQAAKELVLDVVQKLIEPIVADAKLTAEVEPGRVKVMVEDEEHAGLTIGPEGQTISSLQYLANRIVARKATNNFRVHLDAGDYREKQDDSLRQLAWSLAEKAKDIGKTQATRPLSSYHRRVVHMALQEDESVQTRSKGEGPLKRVLILPRRDRQNG